MTCTNLRIVMICEWKTSTAYVSQIEDDQVGYRDKRFNVDLELMC